MMLERSHLSIVREVTRAGGVTAAARRLNLSQSALSHAIAKLEARAGVTIWERRGRALRLTQAGRYLLALAERAIPEFEHAERVLAHFAAGRAGVLRIGMECHPCQKWLMRVTWPFLQAWPGVDIDLRTAFRFDGTAALQAHEIDILVTPDPVDAPDLRFTPVFDYELLLAVHAAHPLAARARLAPADLAGEALITVPVSEERLDVYTRFLLPARRRPRRRIEVETTDLMLQLVAAGRGVAALPDWLLREDAGDLPIRTVRFGDNGLDKSIHLGCRVEDAGIDYVSGFVAIAGAVSP